MSDQPLTRFLYRASLEAPPRWTMIFGLEPLNIFSLQAFVSGFSVALESTSCRRDDDFFRWLRDEAGDFPSQGWARLLLDREKGDHQAAIGRLFEHLHRHLLETRPPWFVQLNLMPLPSLLANGLGAPLNADVRLTEHVVAATAAPPVAALDLRFSAFELGDGFVMHVGLPPDVGTWWSGSGRRIAMMGSKPRLDAIRGSTRPLRELVSSAEGEAEGCVLDATAEGVDVVAIGACGAVLIRDGQLFERSVAGEVAHWSLLPGDRVLLLSGPLFNRANEAGRALPRQLATGEPVAWAQFFDVTGRRLAVSVLRR